MQAAAATDKPVILVSEKLGSAGRLACLCICVSEHYWIKQYSDASSEMHRLGPAESVWGGRLQLRPDPTAAMRQNQGCGCTDCAFSYKGAETQKSLDLLKLSCMVHFKSAAKLALSVPTMSILIVHKDMACNQNINLCRLLVKYLKQAMEG